MTVGISESDVFIVGGGPAGIATAIFARQKGLSVTLADHALPARVAGSTRARPINGKAIYKACGEGLLPDTVAGIALLGVKFQDDEAIPFRGIRFRVAGSCRARNINDASCNLSVEANFPGPSGLGVRRTILHAKLLQRAAQLGVSFAWGTRVTRLGTHQVECNGAGIGSRWVIGADGQ